MAWKKLGLIHALAASPDRATTHMQGPVAIILPNCIRILFAARDARGKSYPAFFDVDRDDPLQVLQVYDGRIIPQGSAGTFDEDGNMPAAVVESDGALRLYYTGWNARTSVPYHNSIGVALSRDQGRSFERMFDGPILDRNAAEPFMTLAPCVLRDERGWHMWYSSGLGWHRIEDRLEPLYAIMSATSSDGLVWCRTDKLTLPRRNAREATVRPTVLRQNGRFHMWFCHRDSVGFRGGAGSYRIGYAWSNDGENWLRQDELAGIDVSAGGWDSEMICYPNVVACDGRILMFYNGNGFGQSGIGYALWDGPLPC